MAVAVAAALAPLTAPPARAQTAAEISNDRDLQKAYDDSFAAMLAEPQNLDKTYAFAEIAARKGDLEGAVSALERMLFINPDLPRVKLELGVLYMRLNSLETARAYLQDVLTTPNVPPQVREKAEGFIRETETRGSTHQLTGSIYSGFRYQSNANVSTSGNVSFNPSFGFIPGTTFTSSLPSIYAKQSDWNFFTAVNAKYSFDFQDQNQNKFEVTASIYSARQQEQTQVNLSYLEVTAGPRIPIPSGWLWEGASMNVRPYALFDYVDLRDDPYYRAPGAGFEIQAEVTQGTVVQVNFEGRDKRYQDSGNFPLLREQFGSPNGAEILMRGTLYQTITDDLTGVLGASILKLNARDGAQAYRYYDYTAGLSFNFDDPLKLTSLPWNVTGTATRAFYIYDRPDISVDPDLTRFDRDWRFSLVGSVPVAESWTVIANIGRTIRQSSIQNYVYENSYGSLGVSFRF